MIKCIDCGKEYDKKYHNKTMGNRCPSCSRIMFKKYTDVFKKTIEKKFKEGHYSKTKLLKEREKIMICKKCGAEFYLEYSYEDKNIKRLCSLCKISNYDYECIDCGKTLKQAINRHGNKILRCTKCHLKYLISKRNKCIDCGKEIAKGYSYKKLRCTECRLKYSMVMSKRNKCKDCGKKVDRPPKLKRCDSCIIKWREGLLKLKND